MFLRWPMGVMAQTETSRHKQKLHGTNINSHGTNETLTAEVIFAAEVNVTSVFTRVARNMAESVEPNGGICILPIVLCVA